MHVAKTGLGEVAREGDHARRAGWGGRLGDMVELHRAPRHCNRREDEPAADRSIYRPVLQRGG
eukprot:8655954-Pyramimonas_sp.AAC.1